MSQTDLNAPEQPKPTPSPPPAGDPPLPPFGDPLPFVRQTLTLFPTSGLADARCERLRALDEGGQSRHDILRARRLRNCRRGRPRS